VHLLIIADYRELSQFCHQAINDVWLYF